MGEIFKENKDSIVRWANLILIILVYFFGIVKSNEKTRMEVIYLQNQINTINVKVDKMDNLKADKEILNLMMNSIYRIETKLDNMNKK